MGIMKFLIYFIITVFVGFPIGITTDDHMTHPEESLEKAEILPLSNEQAYLLDSLLYRRLKRNGFRGTALVSYKNQVVMEYAHGYADYRSKEKIEIESTFQLASVSKSITSTAVMMLKERDLLCFDD
ncbi:MAG: serine hydrolase, partial [Bacteroidales bacterium]|nr:serine hydrolase [Bacteroidales bacterium]